MKIVVIGGSVAENGSRIMIIDIGDSVAEIEDQHENPTMHIANPNLH